MKLERHTKRFVHSKVNCLMVLIGQKAGDWGKRLVGRACLIEPKEGSSEHTCRHEISVSPGSVKSTPNCKLRLKDRQDLL